MDDLDDPLDDLLGGEAVPRTNLRRPLPATYEPPKTFGCEKCGGTGMTRWGKCFRCNGRGTFKTSAADRAVAREKRQDRKAERIAEWRADHKDVVEWIAANPKFAFAVSLGQSLEQYGTLTDGQVSAARKCIQRDEKRRAERNATRDARAVPIETAAIENAFATALEKTLARKNVEYARLRPLLMRTGPKDDPTALDITMIAGTPDSQFAGMLFPKIGDKKLGWVKGGKFTPRMECTDAERDAVAKVCAEPKQAVIAYAQAYSHCCICGQTLTNGESIERGIGPICASKYGW
jgi:hypothetical protein